MAYRKSKFNWATLFLLARSGNQKQVVLKEGDRWVQKELWVGQAWLRTKRKGVRSKSSA